MCGGLLTLNSIACIKLPNSSKNVGVRPLVTVRNLMKQFMVLSLIFGFMGAIAGVLSRSSTEVMFIILLITTAFAAFLSWKEIKNKNDA